MTTLPRDEFDETADHVDEPLTRREALKRLAQLGVSATATTLVAACSSGRSRPSRRRRK
ncbi:MAG: hypothetical protein ACXVX6_02000 [Mycobacterium sp.]